MTSFEPYAVTLAAVIGLMSLAWLLSLILKDSSIADIFWGLGFTLIGWVNFCLAEGAFPRRLLLALLVSIWGVRLALHIGIRSLGQKEDRRYRAFRRRWGARYWWGSFFQVFLLQAVLCWVISLSVQAGQHAQTPIGFTWWTWVAVGVWMVGFLFQTAADWQLMRFKTDPNNRARVLDTGLWRFSRHPNYFGEAVMWWGVYLIVVENGSNLWTIVSPIVITFLLLRVSGVTMMEETVVERRPEYAAYQKKTNAFFPWRPK